MGWQSPWLPELPGSPSGLEVLDRVQEVRHGLIQARVIRVSLSALDQCLGLTEGGPLGRKVIGETEDVGRHG